MKHLNTVLLLVLLVFVCYFGVSGALLKGSPGLVPVQTDVKKGSVSSFPAQEYKAKAVEIAVKEIERLNYAELPFRTQAKFYRNSKHPIRPESGVSVKMYRVFSDYEVTDIYRSDSLLYPVAYEIVYSYEWLTTRAHSSEFFDPEVLAKAQTEVDFSVRGEYELVRRYSCDVDGNYDWSLPALPPRPDFFSVGREMPSEPGSPKPNPLPPPVDVAASDGESKPEESEHALGLIRNGSFNDWHSFDFLPAEWRFAAECGEDEAPSMIRRYARKTFDGGFAVEQTWHKPDRRERLYDQFGIFLRNIKPDTEYKLELKAMGLSKDFVKVSVWILRKGPFKRSKVIPTIIKADLIKVRKSDDFLNHVGTFKTPPDVFREVRLCTYIDRGNYFPVTVVWDEWKLTEVVKEN